MRELKFTQWNQDYINALSDEDYNLLKSADVDLTHRLQDFLTAYDFHPDEYGDERYVNAQELSDRVFSDFVDEEEFCVKFDDDTKTIGVNIRGGWMRQVHTSTLRWVKLHDVPRIIDRYSDSIYQDRKPDQFNAVHQLVKTYREYMTMISRIQSEARFEILANIFKKVDRIDNRYRLNLSPWIPKLVELYKFLIPQILEWVQEYENDIRLTPLDLGGLMKTPGHGGAIDIQQTPIKFMQQLEEFKKWLNQFDGIRSRVENYKIEGGQLLLQETEPLLEVKEQSVEKIESLLTHFYDMQFSVHL